DIPGRQFGADIGGKLTISLGKAGKLVGASVAAGDITIPSGEVAISTDGLGICPPIQYTVVPLQITYKWGDDSPDVETFSCDLSQFTKGFPAPPQIQNFARGAHASAAKLPAFAFTVPPGVAAVDLIVRGAGGSPAVNLKDPHGNVVVPVASVRAKNGAIEFG